MTFFNYNPYFLSGKSLTINVVQYVRIFHCSSFWFIESSDSPLPTNFTIILLFSERYMNKLNRIWKMTLKYYVNSLLKCFEKRTMNFLKKCLKVDWHYNPLLNNCKEFYNNLAILKRSFDDLTDLMITSWKKNSVKSTDILQI